MTMFKTKEQIESEADFLYGEDAKSGDSWKYHTYIAVYTQAQQDIKEACSEGFVGWLHNSSSLTSEQVKKFREMNEQERIGFALSEGFTAGKLSSMKEIQEKDVEIERLKKKISSFDAYASADEKYQEAVKDIEFLTNDNTLDDIKNNELFTGFEEIRTKYGLDKKEK